VTTYGIVDDGRVDVDLLDIGAHLDEFFRGQHHLRRTRRLQRPPDDGLLLRRGRIADEHLHHESVDLRLGERIGAVGLDRVLGRHDQERLRDGERFAPDGHLPLLHDLQQRALHLRGRAVDLVGQQQVGEYRPEGHIELARRLVVDPCTDEVGRHQVRSELDSLELPADRAGQRLDRERLGQPGTPSTSR
jgi:hypothetical protein